MKLNVCRLCTDFDLTKLVALRMYEFSEQDCEFNPHRIPHSCSFFKTKLINMMSDLA